MTRRLFVLTLLGASLFHAQTHRSRTALPPRPKLVLAMIIDQFRYDYLTRFRPEYSGGLDRLLKTGAVFTNARYMHVPTFTAVGHSTFLTGAFPSASGIIGNDWFDREAQKKVTSVSDETVKRLGAEGEGASPKRLMVGTVGDEMKMAGQGSKVIGISLKDRAAILPAGHMADAAYWFDENTGSWVSSTFYFEDLPGWLKEYNASRPADRFAGSPWQPVAPENTQGRTFNRKLVDQPGKELYGTIEASPFGNDLLEVFAERVLDAELLGRRGVTDLLAVSFSSVDYIGHSYGPDSPEIRDACIRMDRTMDKLLHYVDEKVGIDNVLIVLSADHGVASVPDVLQKERMPGGRLQSTASMIQNRLTERYGAGQWVLGMDGISPYLNFELARKKKLSDEELLKSAAEAAMQNPHIYRVYTREQLLAGIPADDMISRKVVNSFQPRRSPDLIVIEDPYWVAASQGTTHGAAWGYDSHVPVIFAGRGIRPGTYNSAILPNDIAPTLATILSVETPAGAAGRVLDEMFEGQ